ncbi:MAG: DNA methyltransferase [Methanoculleus sp.]
MRGREQSFVRVSGGIVTEHFASLLQDEKHGFEYARPVTFVRPWREEDLPPQDEAQFLAQVRDVWDRLLRRFDEKFRDIWAGRMSAEEVRRLWQRPVLDALGFEPTSTTKQIVISDRLKYRFSHRGWFAREGIPKPPVIHILAPGTDPDVRPSRGEPSPHDALQDCLNRHDATWAVLMNETVIRILRDYHHTTVPGYIEFDLEGIFLNRSFPEFLALYRLCHASRFVRDPASGKEPLEEYYEVSRQAGEKIGESLRVNVVQAIEEFGNGFLDGALIERLRGDDGACRAYYQEVLMVVYRIIFMLFAEQRGMLGGGGDHGDLFLEEYSITSLRERVDAFEGRDDRNTDLWEGLSVTFRMLEEGVPELGVNAFDGMLFSNDGARFLKDAKCRNTALMNAIRSLTWTVSETGGRRQRGHGRQRISYADLSVEEIGAIYESLLDYTPRITTGFEEVNGREYRPGQFMLDPRGSERKTTGSYYTNPDLIAELIKSALDPVIADRLSRAGPDPAAREKALLSIRVCDPACGSGAFLIAASNRLGRELAKIRAGTELPSAQEVQAARRDVLAHCIYGVDLNPMAVELARVSLWINALVGDKPLSFLDHHIKCGNSLVGATPELIAGGIPDEAYTAVEGDSKEVAKRIKAANKEQRQTRTFEEFSARSTVLEACAGRFAALAEASEDDPDSVEAKKTEYERLIASSEYAKERLAADELVRRVLLASGWGAREDSPDDRDGADGSGERGRDAR